VAVATQNFRDLAGKILRRRSVRPDADCGIPRPRRPRTGGHAGSAGTRVGSEIPCLCLRPQSTSLQQSVLIPMIEENKLAVQESDDVHDEAETDETTPAIRYDITSYGSDPDVEGLVRGLKA